MYTTLFYEVLSLARDIVEDPLYFEYQQKLFDLNLSKNKTRFVFRLTLPAKCIEMSGINMQLKKDNFYVSVKACNLSEFFMFSRLNKVIYIEIYVSKALCSKKWFDHWDYTSLKFYPYCKQSREFMSYSFCTGDDDEIKTNRKSRFDD